MPAKKNQSAKTKTSTEGLKETAKQVTKPVMVEKVVAQVQNKEITELKETVQLALKEIADLKGTVQLALKEIANLNEEVSKLGHEVKMKPKVVEQVKTKVVDQTAGIRKEFMEFRLELKKYFQTFDNHKVATHRPKL